MLLLATAVAYNRAETGWGPYGGCRGVAKPKKNIPNEKKKNEHTKKSSKQLFFSLKCPREHGRERLLTRCENQARPCTTRAKLDKAPPKESPTRRALRPAQSQS